MKIGEKKKEEKQEELSKGAGKAEATGGEDKKNKTEEQEQLKKKLKEQFEQISAACGQMCKNFVKKMKMIFELVLIDWLILFRRWCHGKGLC